MNEKIEDIFKDSKLDGCTDTAPEADPVSSAPEDNEIINSPSENGADHAEPEPAGTTEAPSSPEGGADAHEADISAIDGRLDEISGALYGFHGTAEILSGKVDSIAEQIGTIKSVLARLAAYDTAVDTLKQSLTLHKTRESNLNKEVEEYKKGTYFTNIRPFLMFMIEMLCEMKKSKEQYIEDKEDFIASSSEKIYAEIINLIDFYIGSFESQLRIQGVTITSYEAGTDYISGCQRITKVVKTDDKNMSGKTEQILSDCYSYEKTILKPANVSVYKA